MSNEHKPLTQMQQFFLERINESDRELPPNYLAVLYYESIGKRKYASSRSSFGQTTAAYKTCYRLVDLGLIKSISEKTNSGYPIIKFAKISKQ